MFDTKSLTLGEVDAIETLSGLPIGALADDDKPKGKALTALAYVIKRREDPKFTYKDASNLTMGEVNELTGSGEAEVADDPKDEQPTLTEPSQASSPVEGEPQFTYGVPALPTSPSSSSGLG